MLNLDDANANAMKMFSTNWVKWIHEGTKPAENVDEKSSNAKIISAHCPTCLNLNGCCFTVDKCPQMPLHPKCHCYTIDIPNIQPKIVCAIEKFKNYLFVYDNGKKELFELWGYSIIDSEELQQEFIKQAERAYSIGDYELGKLNDYGQRIKIRITLKRKDKDGYVTFDSGWMVYPNGKIILITPYGAK